MTGKEPRPGRWELDSSDKLNVTKPTGRRSPLKALGPTEVYWRLPPATDGAEKPVPREASRIWCSASHSSSDSRADPVAVVSLPIVVSAPLGWHLPEALAGR